MLGNHSIRTRLLLVQYSIRETLVAISSAIISQRLLPYDEAACASMAGRYKR